MATIQEEAFASHEEKIKSQAITFLESQYSAIRDYKRMIASLEENIKNFDLEKFPQHPYPYAPPSNAISWR